MCPDIGQGVFLEFDHEISLIIAMLLETLMKLCMEWAKNSFF